MDKKNIICSENDIKLVDGKVVVESSELASEIEGMNIIGDSLNTEEGANSITISVTKS